MDIQLTQGLTFLAWTSVAFLVLIGLFLIRFLLNLSRLINNINKSAEIIKQEIEPILKNIGESAETINRIVQDTDKKVGKFAEAYDKVSNIVIASVTRASALSGIVIKTVLKGICIILKRLLKLK